MTQTTALDRYETPPCALTLGWRLIEANIEEGRVRVGFDAKPEFCNAGGTVQGGFLAAMLDDTLGPVILITTDAALYPTTINLNISYLAPARPGPMVGEARIIQLGKTIAFLEGKLFDADGALVAQAMTSVRVLPMAKVAAPVRA